MCISLHVFFCETTNQNICICLKEGPLCQLIGWYIAQAIKRLFWLPNYTRLLCHTMGTFIIIIRKSARSNRVQLWKTKSNNNGEMMMNYVVAAAAGPVLDPPIVLSTILNTSLAAKGALAHRLHRRTACKIQNGRQGAPKWRTGSGKVSTPRFLGVLSNFR